MNDANKIGDAAPDFVLPDGNGVEWRLSDHRGKTVVLLFYPRDNTPVCTREMCSVRDHWSAYQQSGAEIVGISADSVESHANFASKYQLPLRLLSDVGGKVRDLYGANSIIPGRTGRSEFVIDPQGKIVHRKIRPIGLFRPSDDDILAAIKSASK